VTMAIDLKQAGPLSFSAPGPRTRTQDPIVTGGTVLGAKYRDGVLLITDTLASYGTLARFTDVRRLHKVNATTVIGAGGEYSDFQYIQNLLQMLTIEDFNWDDGSRLTPKEIHNYLSRVLYNRRSKINPLWNQILTAGYHNGQSFLGFVDYYGSTFEEDFASTGYGTYLAMPLIRKRWRPDMTYDEAKSLLDDCMTVCYYRDCKAINRYILANVNGDGVHLSEPYELPTRWDYSLFVDPKA
jgi:20S proteasome subunit beta 7